MSTLLICLVVVGASIGVIARSLARELDKPATDGARTQRATPLGDDEDLAPPEPVRVAVVSSYPPELEGDVRWWQRARSGAELAVLLAVLGAGLAVALGLGFFAGFSAIRDALG